MNLRRYASMDPEILVGLVNTRLRNEHADLADLAAAHDIDPDDLAAVLARAGYAYREDLHQFRARPEEGREG